MAESKPKTDLARIHRFLDDLEELEINVGINKEEGERPKGGTEEATLAAVATWNEFGTTRNSIPHIPPRPTFRQSAVDTRLAERATARLAQSLIRSSFTGQQDTERALAAAGEDAGMVYGEDIARRISSGSPPLNAEVTERAKGFNHPLIETGELQDSISVEVKLRDRRIRKRFARPR